MKAFLFLVAAPGLLWSQVPRIGIIDFYGLQKVPEERVRKVLGAKEGDPLPASKAAAEERLEQIPSVVQARLTAVCCENKAAVLYVGIEEKGAPHFAFRSPPSGSAVLPQELVDAYGKFMEAVQEAVRAGHGAEDLTHGHSLMADPAARQIQERFVDVAAQNLQILRNVLRNGSDAEQRAIAAYLIGYAPDKAAVIGDLEYAMQDPDESVRNNAMRALAAVSVLAKLKPDLQLHISPTWFVEMLNSIEWTDRNKALMALVNLTEGKDALAQEALGQIRQRALPAVIEMARWKSLGHALPAYYLVGRLAGLSEQEIQDTWTHQQREAVIDKLLKPAKKKR